MSLWCLLTYFDVTSAAGYWKLHGKQIIESIESRGHVRYPASLDLLMRGCCAFAFFVGNHTRILIRIEKLKLYTEYIERVVRSCEQEEQLITSKVDPHRDGRACWH